MNLSKEVFPTTIRSKTFNLLARAESFSIRLVTISELLTIVDSLCYNDNLGREI